MACRRRVPRAPLTLPGKRFGVWALRRVSGQPQPLLVVTPVLGAPQLGCHRDKEPGGNGEEVKVKEGVDVASQQHPVPNVLRVAAGVGVDMRSFENRGGDGPGDRTLTFVGRKKAAAKLLLSTALHHGAHDASPVVGIAVHVPDVNGNEGPREVSAGRIDAA